MCGGVLIIAAVALVCAGGPLGWLAIYAAMRLGEIWRKHER